MKQNKLIYNWWFWVCIVLLSFITMFFIVSMTYALHPTEIHIYANDEMVATSENIMSQMHDQNFNDCINKCKEITCVDRMCYDCGDYCVEYYIQKR